MSPRDPKKPPKNEIVTTSGVKVLLNDPARRYAVEKKEEPAPAPVKDAIVFPPGQSIAERNAFMEGLDEQWGRFIDMKLRRGDVPEESARDLRQEALVILFKEYDKIGGPPGNVQAFIDDVLKNLIRNYRRQARVKHAAPGADTDVLPAADDPERAMGRAELEHKYQGYLEQLSPEEREVFEAREVDGMTFGVIAAALSRPVNTVKDQHARAMAKLRDMAKASERGAEQRARAAGRGRGTRK